MRIRNLLRVYYYQQMNMVRHHYPKRYLGVGMADTDITDFLIRIFANFRQHHLPSNNFTKGVLAILRAKSDKKYPIIIGMPLCPR